MTRHTAKIIGQQRAIHKACVCVCLFLSGFIVNEFTHTHSRVEIGCVFLSVYLQLNIHII